MEEKLDGELNEIPDHRGNSCPDSGRAGQRREWRRPTVRRIEIKRAESGFGPGSDALNWSS
ncbi:MAG: hypothetical protein HYX94_09330 [Chloroflexi bacterium]|nr:hypothetical protein [Chloroflexota bacterium]